MIKNEIHYLSREESEKLIFSIKNPKYKLIVLIMLDCGLRVSECCSLQLKNFDFKKRILTIKSLKKRKEAFRKIPISNRLYQAIATYLENAKLNIEADNYLFPSTREKGHICRKTVWKFLNRKSRNLNILNLHPHTLRHTFATHHLSAGTQLAEIKEMLGHASYDTTLIYASIPTETLQLRVNTVTQKKQSKFQKIVNRLFNPKANKVINLNFSNEHFTIGRNQELSNINTLIDKGINTLIVGPIGVGKSHLLQNLETSKKILRLDDTDSIKKTLVQILLYLYKGDKQSVLDLIWKGFTIEEIKKRIQRENVTQLCKTITSIVEPKEYILLIDDITRITPTAKKTIEKLKDTFVIVTSARQVLANDTSFLWNFEVVKIENLNRNYAMQLINQMITGVEAENIDVLRTHIYEQTNGNPRAITELVDRYRKEPFLTDDIVRSIKHTGALPYLDMSYLIIIFLGALTATRYMSRELELPALRFIGSLALILLIISRPLFKNLKSKFI